MNRVNALLHYLLWLFIYFCVIVGVKVFYGLIFNSGHKVDFTKADLNYPLFLAIVLWLIHIVKGDLIFLKTTRK